MKVVLNSPAATTASAGTTSSGSGGLILGVLFILGIGFLAYQHFTATPTEDAEAEIVK